jgi:hypothetical protein
MDHRACLLHFSKRLLASLFKNLIAYFPRAYFLGKIPKAPFTFQELQCLHCAIVLFRGVYFTFQELHCRLTVSFYELHCLFSKSLLHVSRTLHFAAFFQEATSLFKNFIAA